MSTQERIADPLVSTSNVNGTRVFSRTGEELGHIDHLMIDKKSGKVAYAVMHFGGFLGMGEEAHPVPWNKLNYDTQRDGFVTDITREQIEGAPRRPDDWQRDRRWEEQTFTHWGVPPYWI
ncbi:photosystem reaction center subunit H [Brevirhabdus pacifica]|uniref:Photosystem reaction center subunit H n=1 Tax=Brevirhabdus pacifica TaxID=1267768 RepID=A0A1U7DK60_9RHOB|nr:PRC-barrel domain-containing protein [Brevirhabdus pacifica]APX90407.1 photosystem reaction center subunit H [Brevirhabdus pacifica]OWU78569.1 photosystem reaction center subunit H [Loktanella sp. 22II-4b]PJJ85502.1 PRC-barrel domain protein [Brevirhabdus pacifica]